MRWVIGLSRRNVENASGGPFAAAVFDSGSGTSAGRRRQPRRTADTVRRPTPRSWPCAFAQQRTCSTYDLGADAAGPTRAGDQFAALPDVPGRHPVVGGHPADLRRHRRRRHRRPGLRRRAAAGRLAGRTAEARHQRSKGKYYAAEAVAVLELYKNKAGDGLQQPPEDSRLSSVARL